MSTQPSSEPSSEPSLEPSVSAQPSLIPSISSEPSTSSQPSASAQPSFELNFVPESTFQYFRFTPTKLRSPSTNRVELSEMQLYFRGNRLYVENAINMGGSSPSGYEPMKAIDNDVNTKWINYSKGSLVLEFSTRTSINGYRWYTSSGYPYYDPIRWRLDGSNDKSSWTTIDDRRSRDQNVPWSRRAVVV